MHCHVQIEYIDHDGTPRESLIGFDPRNDKDKELIHKMLDEYLEVWKVRLDKNEGAKSLDFKEEGFHIFSNADTHGG